MMSSRRPLSICSVCGDKASGKHYGVLSCDGCRGFFKRSVRRQIQYKCKGDSTCQVDVNRRNQCQACRFQRCLAMKMKPSAVQHERAPRASTRRPLPIMIPARFSSSQASAFAHPHSSSQVTLPFVFPNLYSRVDNIIPSVSFSNSSFNSSSESISDCSGRFEIESSDDQICETASFILLESIRWLFSVPSFHELDRSDQYVLIDHWWSIEFLLTSAEKRKFLDPTHFSSISDEFQAFQLMVKNFVELAVESTEFMLLKLFVIFHAPNNVELRDRFRINQFHKDALFMLTEYTRQSKYRRLAELLMLISASQEILARIDLEKLFFGHFINQISMRNLLRKIIDQRLNSYR